MRKMVSIIIVLVLIIATLSLNASAGDINNPEIIDEENDIIGTLAKHTAFFNILKAIGIVPIQSFEFIDILSAWFYENQTKPDFLFASIKIKDLEYTPLRAIYSIRWSFNEKKYAAFVHTHSNGEFKWFGAGRIFGLFDNWAYKQGLIRDISECAIDNEKNLIILKIPKNIIGNPKPGDILLETNAWTGLRFILEVLTYPFGGEMVKDPTVYGNNYIIQY